MLALPPTPLAEAERQISSASKRAAVRSGKDYRDFSELWHAVVLLEPSSAASALFSRHALRAAAAFPAIRFLIVQDAQFSSFGALYSVRGFPSVLLFSDGHLMDRFNERAGLTNFIAAVTGANTSATPLVPRGGRSLQRGATPHPWLTIPPPLLAGIKPLPECPFAVVPQPMEVSESWDWALVGTSAFLLIDAAAVTHSYLARRRGGG